jgi:hypothetical protein
VRGRGRHQHGCDPLEILHAERGRRDRILIADGFGQFARIGPG